MNSKLGWLVIAGLVAGAGAAIYWIATSCEEVPAWVSTVREGNLVPLEDFEYEAAEAWLEENLRRGNMTKSQVDPLPKIFTEKSFFQTFEISVASLRCKGEFRTAIPPYGVPCSVMKLASFPLRRLVWRNFDLDFFGNYFWQWVYSPCWAIPEIRKLGFRDIPDSISHWIGPNATGSNGFNT